VTTARPIQAALISALSFAVGAAMPLAMVLLMPPAALVAGVSIGSLVFLALLGAIGARAGGAKVGRGTLRVTFWGKLAMPLTAGIGAIEGDRDFDMNVVVLAAEERMWLNMQFNVCVPRRPATEAGHSLAFQPKHLAVFRALGDRHLQRLALR
jgi:hypothetical protein